MRSTGAVTKIVGLPLVTRCRFGGRTLWVGWSRLRSAILSGVFLGAFPSSAALGSETLRALER
uniref:Uncharacterized protein n=1 Tax=Hyaloperonospora arabidopsidis (strain Emoy2) TaxID=559515 RepID=M4BMV0_HYAAE